MLQNLAPSTVPMAPPSLGDLAPVEYGFSPKNTISVNQATGVVHSENDDGSVTISFGDDPTEEKDASFNDNLATDLAESTLNMISEEILRGIEEDLRSREDWDSTFSSGLDLLGLNLKATTSSINSSGTVSSVHHTILIEAVVHYQANAQAELLPASGPVKVRDDAPGMTPERIQMAEDFEKDFNHNLTVTRKEYYPDTRRMLFAQGFCGNGFKKVYRCPLRKSPVSDYVAAKDLIVSNEITSLSSAARVTHRTAMRHSVMTRLQLNGHYRKCTLTTPTSQPTNLDRQIGEIEGLDRTVTLPSDHQYTVYECYTEYDIPGFRHKDEDDEFTTLPLPYRITIDKDSRKVLEIRKNWKEGDPDYMPRQRFVHYGYIPGFGFYHYGLVHLLGQTARALTAIERQLIDAGQFANFPGLLLSDVGGRQETTQIRMGPGGTAVIKTGGLPLQQVVMPLPYKEPSGVLVNIAKAIEDNGRRLGGTNEVNVGEGRADVPVGTTIALIEQGTKVEGAVHKQNHESQQQEFLLLKELFEEEPEALNRGNKNPARVWQTAAEFADADLVPASDPNTPSHIHRVMKATGLSQVAANFGDMVNRRAVATILITTLGFSPSAILNPATPPSAAPPAPPPDPVAMAKIQSDQQKTQVKLQETQINAGIKQKQMDSDAENQEAQRQNALDIQKLKTTGTVLQQKSQQDADASAEVRGFHQENVSKHIDHAHAMQENSQQNEFEKNTHADQRAHEKTIAQSKSNVLSSEK